MDKSYSTNEYKVDCERPCDCESKVINSKTLAECENEHLEPMGVCGPLIAKIPVVLSEVKIQIDLESDIELDQPAFDVKTIDKRVCITQCHLVPFTNKLFIAGFVQKNIQYSTVECANKTSISGSILHTTVNIPFKCVTAIKFDRKPIFGKSFKTKINVLEKDMDCPDDREESWIHFNKFHEPVFCELQWSKILESDIFDRNIRYCAVPFTKENCFQTITEKMVVYVAIKVLQNQQVFIPEPNYKPEKTKECDHEIEKEKSYNFEDKDYYEEVEVEYMSKKKGKEKY